MSWSDVVQTNVNRILDEISFDKLSDFVWADEQPEYNLKKHIEKRLSEVPVIENECHVAVKVQIVYPSTQWHEEFYDAHVKVMITNPGIGFRWRVDKKYIISHVSLKNMVAPEARWYDNGKLEKQDATPGFGLIRRD